MIKDYSKIKPQKLQKNTRDEQVSRRREEVLFKIIQEVSREKRAKPHQSV